MALKPSGLGRGLSALIPNKIKPEVLPEDSALRPKEEKVLQIAVNEIKTNPQQPRADFSHESLEDLINSIKEHGILQPLIVTQTVAGYQLIVGERRLRAAKILEQATVPAIVREAQEQQQLELALVENLQRKDLNPIEEAVAYQRLIDEFSLTQEAVAKRVGKNRAVVANILRLLYLPTEIQKALIEGKINYSTARVIVGLPAEQRLDFFAKVLKNDLTVRAVEGQAKKIAVRKHFRQAQDPQIKAWEEALERSLQTKVVIKKSGATGQIIIEFYSAEELAELLKKLTPESI